MVTVLRQHTCSLPATMPGATLGTGLEGGQPWTRAQTHYFLIYIPGHEVSKADSHLIKVMLQDLNCP